MASLWKTISNSANVTLEASNRIVVSTANVGSSSAQGLEEGIDVLRDGIRICKSHSKAQLVETELANGLKLRALEALNEDEDYRASVIEMYKTAKLAELKEDLDLE